MTKKQQVDGDSADGAKKKKPAAKKAAPAKKPSTRRIPRPTKGPSRGSAKPAAKKKSGAGSVEEVIVAPVVELAEDLDEPETIVEAGVDADADDEDDDEDDGSSQPIPVALTEEEQELKELYGTDLTAPATAHVEYTDRQTADEDRPMLPEINARDERKHRWEDRRDRKRQRREQRERERLQRRDNRPTEISRPPEGMHASSQHAPSQRASGHASSQHSSSQHASSQHASPQQRLPLPPPMSPPSAPPAVNGHDDPLARVGTPLGDAAATVFAQLRNNQPLPVRQLAAMMRKRSLVQLDPEQLWPQLKAELLGDERSYRTLGLRPRIVYRGRDLFAPGPVATSATADAEAGVAAALSRLAGATHRALSQRIAKASPAGFERIIHAYLVAAGYREIDWVKRVGGISYASAIAPGLDRTVLISARSGDQPIDRRGIGELRVGVEAKNLVAGILFAARELSEDAERELERPGRSVAVMCGDSLVAALVSAGVGVVSSAAPLHYVDDQLLDELLAG